MCESVKSMVMAALAELALHAGYEVRLKAAMGASR